MSKDPEELAHLEWLGYVQPVGLVVSVPALLAAQAHVNRNIAPEHREFLSCLPKDRSGEIIPEIRDISEFTSRVLGWEPSDLVSFPNDGSIPANMTCLEVLLPEYHETLRPTHVVPEFRPREGQKPWMMLVQVLPSGTNLDEPRTEDHRNWHASPHAKFERLLREADIPIGLLFNATHLRLVYAPRGETSGYATFSVSEMAKVAGRPIFAAFHMLLSGERLFSVPEAQRLPAILAESRKYQNTVSTQLAEQVLEALYELLRGFQAADDQRHGQLLRKVLAQDPNHVYAGLLTVLMRLVFILYAEDRGLMPGHAVYANHYAVTGLFERLREDAGRYPDTMDLRYGAWAQLLTLFRLIHRGGNHGELRIPAREGYLFDPDRYPFLEGRELNAEESEEQGLDIPRVSDGVVFRVLQNLLILAGERLSYRTLDVEQIGSVYETIMGFYLETAKGRSIAIKPSKSHGAPFTLNLDALLAVKSKDRVKWFRDQTDQKLTGQAAVELPQAQNIDEVLAALDKKTAKKVTPNIVPTGAMVLQPSDERRRSGSHYTPRSLTEPIVRTALEPILRRLGEQPRPDRILDLKVCDPAMGSGAFLVEVCRQLGGLLVKSWHIHDAVPVIPPDEDELLHAARLIAQRCVYGVDKNPMAVDLAKLSLWLATLAKDHAFTFLDHCLRCGDSLVGLSREQIARFHWEASKQIDTFENELRKRLEAAKTCRRELVEKAEFTSYRLLQQKLGVAEERLGNPKFMGDLVVAAFFSADKDRERRQKRDDLLRHAIKWMEKTDRESLSEMKDALNWLSVGGPPVRPFHWELEFPEVFDQENGGFDAILGNPPFAGKNTLINSHRKGYLDWLKGIHEESHGNSDLVAHFFRRSFGLLRNGGCLGLIATNTIGQGDTRSTGLCWICAHGGTIYSSRRRYAWPGQAAVIVSVVHICRGWYDGIFVLDGRQVPRITAYLFHSGGHNNPQRLVTNIGKSFIGCYLLGMGFTFEDTGSNGLASPISLMKELIEKDSRNGERIRPYIGGEEVNDHPSHAPSRFVIDFEQMTENEAWQWPDLMRVVEQKVKPQRMAQNDREGRKKWWQFLRPRPELRSSILGLKRILAIARVTRHVAFTFLPSEIVFNEKLVLFPTDSHAVFCIMQSRLHEQWTWFFSSTLKDDLNYSPSDCFENFPCPVDFDMNLNLQESGRLYYEFRANLMIRNNEGLTRTYNRFHDPHETAPEIRRLRELHDAMDRAVLDAYGWTKLEPTCEFLLDYEDEDDADENGGTVRGRSRRKPWRYRWPDDFRDEVLARLLELNKERAEQERLASLTVEAGAAKSKGKANKNNDSSTQQKKKKLAEKQPNMFKLD